MNSYEKVIFLDIDGVLNYIGSRVVHGMYAMDKNCVQILKEIVEEHNSALVISSSWRRSDDWEKIVLDNFSDVGWSDPPVIGRTPILNLYKGRGKEIREWLEKNPTRSYIILDDDSDMLPEQLPFFIQTSMYTKGLTKEHAERIRFIWKK